MKRNLFAILLAVTLVVAVVIVAAPASVQKATLSLQKKAKPMRLPKTVRPSI